MPDQKVTDAERIKELERALQDERIKLEVRDIQFKQLLLEKRAVDDKLKDARRFKNALKLVLRAVDNIITARIEHLRKVKLGHTIQLNNIDASVFDMSSKEALLKSLHSYDLQTYFTVRKHRQQTFYTYKIVNGIYSFIRRGVAKIFGLLFVRQKKEESND